MVLYLGCGLVYLSFYRLGTGSGPVPWLRASLSQFLLFLYLGTGSGPVPWLRASLSQFGYRWVLGVVLYLGCGLVYLSFYRLGTGSGPVPWLRASLSQFLPFGYWEWSCTLVAG